ncbi:porin [Hyphomicrobium sp.]|uniref:porin n=1 Tax=Hyphomicrobium sp. TaxID=82 RepID=UPI0025C2E2BC|nr:porin [Hyphomicrobium sp.]MCC7252875.1 porin [Hyphomicrobium sp.]
MRQAGTGRAARRTLAAAAGILLWGAASAGAADLGGDCCADLEERIAELEATTARKGNRKVSLTISGWVNEAAFFWDDGQESNVYIATNSLEQDRFKLTGEAKIVDGWSAGYTIEIGIWGSASNGTNADVDNGPSGGSINGLVVRKSNWFLKSKDLGKLTVGLEGTATYHLLDDADGANTRNYSDAEAAAVALSTFREINTNVTWTSLMGGFNNATPGQSGRRNVVRYDSPTFAGFTFTAAWGEDDMWDTALTYKNDLGDFSVVAKVGYGESSDPSNGGGCAVGNGDCQWWGAAGTIMHVPTGLYVYGGYGATQIDLLPAQVGDDESTTWFVQAGIERKFIPLGRTTIFGEYRNDEAGLTANGLSSDLDFWAAGIVQNIDAAAMDLYVIYRNASGDAALRATGVSTELEDLDMVITGARIQF